MRVPVKDLTGAEVGTIDLNDAVFGVAMRQPVVHQALVRQRANSRQGTHNTKTRADVSGGGRKPFPQKHTGRARGGSRRSPLWRHGGTVFGPHPRDYSQAMPRKMRRLAILCMLSDKQSTGSLIVLKDLDLKEGKTKEITSALSALGVQETALLVTAAADPNLTRASRNLSAAKSLPASLLNVGDLVKYRHLVMTESAVHKAEEVWTAPVDRKRAPMVEMAPSTTSSVEAPEEARTLEPAAIEEAEPGTPPAGAAPTEESTAQAPPSGTSGEEPVAEQAAEETPKPRRRRTTKKKLAGEP